MNLSEELHLNYIYTSGSLNLTIVQHIALFAGVNCKNWDIYLPYFGHLHDRLFHKN